MKKLIVTLFFVGIGLIGFAQEKDNKGDIETLFGGQRLKVTGGFGGVDWKATRLNGRTTWMVGGKAALTFNEKVNIGLAGYGLNKKSPFQGTDPAQELWMSFNYAGLYAEYIMNPNKLFHISFPLIIGSSHVNVRDQLENYPPNHPDNDFDPHVIEDSNGFVIEPGVNVELNVLKFMKVGASGGYRFVGNHDLKNVSNGDLNNWSFSVGVKFGWF
ncbi:hypothetical protein [Flexithrix dorotheae]|uniref:hypothetical protein n=1 Tax=Flexithrix dorotheae TaxID=70993 RepID=UPI00037C98A6|nr:hypothetical protein [Flexithrix dorotheae]